MADTTQTQTPASSAGQSTRQLLDELDVLMQRMLALPVQEGDGDKSSSVEEKLQPGKAEEAPTKNVTPRNVTLRPVASQSVTLQQPTTTAPPPVVVAGRIPAFWPAANEQKVKTPSESPQRLVPPPSAPAMAPIIMQSPKVNQQVAPPPQQPARAPLAEAPRTLPQPKPSPAVKITPPPASTTLNPQPESPGGIWRLILAINGAYDLFTLLLGPLGRWMRGDQGRTIVGLIGLAMITAAVIWALQLIPS